MTVLTVTQPDVISVAEARRLLLAGLTPLAPLPVAAAEACGHVLAETVVAGEAVPRFANSAMDGYAVRAADVAEVPVRLRVTGTVAAGDGPGPGLAPGTAVRIMTGAPLPAGADVVCPVERVLVDDDGSAVLIKETFGLGANVRLPGEDIAAGSVVFPAGTQLRAAHVGVLASLGTGPVLVRPRPVVAVLSTGSELARPGAALGAGQIRDVNRPALLAQLRADGFPVIDLGACADDRDALSGLLTAAAARCDAIVATGGVSVGDHDELKAALGEAGGETMRWLRVAVKPGKHVAAARLGARRVPAFGLPGNPVAALVTYELYVRPALRRLAGCAVIDRPRFTATAETSLPRCPGPRLHVVRVTARTGPRGNLLVRSAGGQGSHMLRAMAQANALALLPDGDGVRAGGSVEVMLLDPDVPGPDGADTRWADAPPAVM
jgi:molybdenum cofactor synthesis domain-containing protein